MIQGIFLSSGILESLGPKAPNELQTQVEIGQTPAGFWEEHHGLD